jgi:hypothetical protein
VTDAYPAAVVELMQRLWHHEPQQRPECIEALEQLTKIKAQYLEKKAEWQALEGSVATPPKASAVNG